MSYLLGAIAFSIALIWFAAPIIYFERTNYKTPFVVGVFAWIGYYWSGFTLYKLHKKRVVDFLEKYGL